MNKKIIAGAVLAVASGAAFAQSSVTLYGVADAGLTASKGVPASDNSGVKKSRIGLDSGLLSGSRVGFKGVEDLGSGTSAIFNVEAGFDLSNGSNTAGSLFNRRAIVGLTNASYGTLELGRQDSVLDDLIGTFDASGNATAAGAGNIIKYDDRISNSITYTTADYAGFTAKANYGFGENTSAAYGSHNASDGRFYGLSLNYANDAFAASLAGGHSDYKGTNQSVADAATAFGKAAKRDIYLLGASYDFGAFKPFALVSYGKSTMLDASPQVKDKSATLGVAVPFGASTVMASAGYVNVKPQGGQSVNAQQYYVAYTYDFSKRTTFYAAYDAIKSSSKLKASAYADAFTTGTGGNQVFGVGIRHKF